jgi:nucleotide-binding universal stress UspA family protein
MNAITSILVPTDFSQCANSAVEHGVFLAETFNAKLHILFVVEPIDTYVSINGIEQSVYVDLVRNVRDSAQTKLEALRQELEQKQLSVTTATLEGKPADAILDYASDNGITLICLSTHGRSGLNHLLLGSTTEKVLRKSRCPVYVVRGSDS